jgi:predicted adenine nucleotide alpha hydrolase (AANH) superfamily ATPase
MEKKDIITATTTADRKPRLLLSACCGCCSTVALERLTADYDITIFFFGDNLDTKEEYTKRLTALKTVNSAMNSGKKMLVKDYDRQSFLSAVSDLLNEKEGGCRCEECFRLRLTETAKVAGQYGFNLFATTLTVSPHKNAELINKIGGNIADAHGLQYLKTDFKQNNGFARSVELSKQLKIYRQNYCGCKI